MTQNLILTMTILMSFKKKKKLEHEKIISKIREAIEEIDISEQEICKFLLIFNTLIETVHSII